MPRVRALLASAAVATFLLLPQVPWPLADWPRHALTHALAAASAAALVAALWGARVPEGRLGRVVRVMTLLACSWMAAAQALESVSAYTERDGAGPLHEATTLATMLGMAAAIPLGIGWVALRLDRRQARWVGPIGVVIVLVALAMVLGVPGPLLER